ncbi:hypothetical protein BO83DRAFT_66663 [Aspergillus eucalypticola CBS 122712]|uniref:Uncharacterized protein n=1 Tax=Aspergillus eucalypticola (strain CBS 122712 / IBT 29274) TaxID=1448314 RepID=A0A317VBE1_ASPEC|nr:uncharacterized protein BO83DRAFT_66663 [Aspergillus eucalypticola CBS 122712]PWY69240.1 hypothetical protein BO83DRAFT_66663 [Aspergillus eucalypticola CBS 122712]
MYDTGYGWICFISFLLLFVWCYFRGFQIVLLLPLPYLYFTVLCGFVSTFPGLLTFMFVHPSIHIHQTLIDDGIWMTILRVSFIYSFFMYHMTDYL